MKKLTLDPPRSIPRNQLIARRAEAIDQMGKASAYKNFECEPYSTDHWIAHGDVRYWQGRRDLLNELIGEQA